MRASDDEVIVGHEEDDPANRFEVMSDITLSLGDRVTIDTMGLTGRLTGSIAIRSGYDAITRGTGELSVAGGSYTAYARKLDIQRGRLIFTGGPIDNPGIDLRAAKVFPDVTAGVNVRGTLLQPRMSFFSDPPLTAVADRLADPRRRLAGDRPEGRRQCRAGPGRRAARQPGRLARRHPGREPRVGRDQ